MTFTCTAPGPGNNNEISWLLPNQITVTLAVREDTLNMPRNEFGYIVEATALNSTSVTSTLIATAEEGLTIICEEALSPGNQASITIQLASKSIITVKHDCRRHMQTLHRQLCLEATVMLSSCG